MHNYKINSRFADVVDYNIFTDLLKNIKLIAFRNTIKFQEYLPHASSDNGIYRYSDTFYDSWHGGWWTGIFYLAYEAFGDERFRHYAENISSRFYALIKNNRIVHREMGLIYLPICVPDIKINQNSAVLLPDEEKTYKFIEAEIKTVRSCFRSNRIHLGMDEAIGLGLGKHYQKFGHEKPLDIFNRHLRKVLDIAKKYGYEPMIWGDMYFGSEDANYYYETDAVIPDYALKSAPKDTQMVFWDYYHDFYDYYDKKFKQFNRFENTTAYGGGVWTWDGFAPNFEYTLKTMEPALRCSIDNGIKTVIATMWANGGCETDFFKAFDSLAIFSEFCYKGSECSKEDIYASAGHIINADIDFSMAVSSFHLSHPGADGVGKGLFYCDPLINLLCWDIEYEETKRVYEKAIDTLKKYSDHPWFKYYTLLFEIVRIKADIVLNLQKEYINGNMDYMKNLADNVMPELIKYYKEFFEEFSKHWHQSYNPFGFEVYAQRFGGIEYRLKYAIERLNEYCSGKRLSIEELEEKIEKGLNRSWKYANSYMNTCL